MAKPSSIVVSVRMEESNLRKLQLIAQVYEQPVGALIREAVERYTKAVARTKDFRTKAPEVLARNQQMLEEFLKAVGTKEK
jgi:hypothetical protein